jgi:hypothetical protein
MGNSCRQPEKLTDISQMAPDRRDTPESTPMSQERVDGFVRDFLSTVASYDLPTVYAEDRECSDRILSRIVSRLVWKHGIPIENQTELLNFLFLYGYHFNLSAMADGTANWITPILPEWVDLSERKGLEML